MIPLEIFVGEAMEATEVARGDQGQVQAAASPGDAVGFGKPGARRKDKGRGDGVLRRRWREEFRRVG